MQTCNFEVFLIVFISQDFVLRTQLIGHFQFQKLSLPKGGQVHSFSCENDFYLHENEKSFPYQRLST